MQCRISDIPASRDAIDATAGFAHRSVTETWNRGVDAGFRGGSLSQGWIAMSGSRHMRTVQLAGIVAATAGLAVVVGLAASRQGKRDERASRLFDEVRHLVLTRAVDSMSDDSLFVKAAGGLVNAIGDPYASLFSQKAMAGFMRNDIGNAYGGLGMSLERHPGGIAVAGVFHNSPAALGGVMAGDEIVAVNGTAVSTLSGDRVSQLLVGEPGSGVDITFLRAGVTTPIHTH